MRRLLVVAAVSSLVGLTLPGCFTHACEGDIIDKPYGEADGEGHFIDDRTWESMPLQAEWLAFPAGRIWKIRIPAWERARRPVVSLSALVSPAEFPNRVQASGVSDNWTDAPGNLAEFSEVTPGNFHVKNATCTDLFVRVVVRAGEARDSGAGDAQNE